MGLFSDRKHDKEISNESFHSIEASKKDTMKEKIISKQWLLGILIGLVILVVAAPVMASYVLENSYGGNDFEGKNGDTVRINGGNYIAVKYDSGSTGSVTYDDLTFNVEIGTGKCNTCCPGTDPADGYQTEWGVRSPNSWTLDTTKNIDVDYFSVKGGNGYNLFQQTSLSNTDTRWLAPVKQNGGGAGKSTYGVSHVTFYYRASPVPIPSSILLFGSGLVGLVGISRRRRKK